MSFQVAFGGGTVRAIWALKWFLPSVRSQVSLLVHFAAETLGAHRAEEADWGSAALGNARQRQQIQVQRY